jgi:hypothetical protein
MIMIIMIILLRCLLEAADLMTVIRWWFDGDEYKITTIW